MGRFKKGQVVYRVYPIYSEKNGTWDKEAKAYDLTVAYGSMEKCVVESCGKKRLYLFDDSNNWRKSFDADDPNFFFTKEEALADLVRFGNSWKEQEVAESGKVGSKKALYYIRPVPTQEEIEEMAKIKA